MKALFCESTADISLVVSKHEAEKLKHTQEATLFLHAEHKGLAFSLMNSNPKDTSYIQIMEPKNKSALHYYIKMSDRAYADLMRDGQCGTRYGMSSKIHVTIDDELLF